MADIPQSPGDISHRRCSWRASANRDEVPHEALGHTREVGEIGAGNPRGRKRARLNRRAWRRTGSRARGLAQGRIGRLTEIGGDQVFERAGPNGSAKWDAVVPPAEHLHRRSSAQLTTGEPPAFRVGLGAEHRNRAREVVVLLRSRLQSLMVLAALAWAASAEAVPSEGRRADPLNGLREGRAVVVYCMCAASEQSAAEIDAVGLQGLNVMEGTITALDREHHQFTVRYTNGRSEKLWLSVQAVAEVARDAELAAPDLTKVAIYCTDLSGEKIVHFVRRVP